MDRKTLWVARPDRSIHRNKHIRLTGRVPTEVRRYSTNTIPLMIKSHIKHPNGDPPKYNDSPIFGVTPTLLGEETPRRFIHHMYGYYPTTLNSLRDSAKKRSEYIHRLCANKRPDTELLNRTGMGKQKTGALLVPS